MAKGCHRLIREGARLVETVEEIVEGIAPMAGDLAQRLMTALSAAQSGLVDKPASDPKMTSSQRANDTSRFPTAEQTDPEYQRLWNQLGFDPKPVDRLVEQCGLTAREVSAMLLMLELKGAVEAHPGGAFSRKR
jgi:DNA processing protein